MGNSEKASPYGKGFIIRMVVLLGLLGLVAAGFYFEKSVYSEKRDEVTNEAYKLLTIPEDEGGSEIDKAQVQKTIGFAPAKTEKFSRTEDAEATPDEFMYEVETYNLPTLNPTAPYYLTVVYDDNRLANILQNKPFTREAMTGGATVELGAPKDEWTPRMIGAGGGGGGNDGQSGDDDDDSENDSEEDTSDDEDSDEGESDDQPAETPETGEGDEG